MTSDTGDGHPHAQPEHEHSLTAPLVEDRAHHGDIHEHSNRRRLLGLAALVAAGALAIALFAILADDNPHADGAQGSTPAEQRAR